VSPVKYELVFYISEDDILQSHCRENLKSYITLTGWTLQRRGNVSPVKYELGFCIPEDGILHSHRRESLKYYGCPLLKLKINFHYFCCAFAVTDCALAGFDFAN
jgi:hypothetical protein